MHRCRECVCVMGAYAWTTSLCVCAGGGGGCVAGGVYMHKGGCVHTHREYLYVHVHWGVYTPLYVVR